MRCPFCGHNDTSVKDSRTMEDNTAIKRRRFCDACGSRFTTFEHVQLRDIMVIKKNGEKDIFDRDKLSRALGKAVHKRAIPQEQIDRVIASITRKIETSGNHEISSTELGKMVMEALFHLDPVAYIRFVSVYQEFGSINDFIHIIQRIQNQTEHVEN